MKRKFFTRFLTLTLAVCCLMLTTACSGGSGGGGGAKLEYAYGQAVAGAKLEMDNYNGMDLAGLEMYRYNSMTFDTYSDGTYVLKVGVSFAINSPNGSMGGSNMTYIGTYTAEAVNAGDDNTEFIYTLSVPTRVIAATDISYMGSSLVDTDDASTYPEEDAGNDAAAEVKALLNEGQYYSEITADREFCTITDSIMSTAP